MAKTSKKTKTKTAAQDEERGIGDNSGVSGKRIKSFVERVERLEEEKKGLADDIRDVYSEAKATGFDVKTIRKLVKIRKMDAEKRREEQELLDLYCAAVRLSGLPDHATRQNEKLQFHFHGPA